MGSPVKKTMIQILLDESGSMASLLSDVIGGINLFIDDQRKLPEPAVLSIVVFGSHIPGIVKVVRPMVNIHEVAKLTEADYAPNGGTPLLDATGKSILSLDEDWKREKPDRCIFVSFTDGEENSSTEFTKGKIKQLQEAREKSGLWAFLFLGANIDSFREGASMGYHRNLTANYNATSKGFRAAAAAMSETTYNLRGLSDVAYANTASGAMDAGLGGNIGEDGSISNAVDASVNSINSGSALPPGTPSAAAMAQQSWVPPTSSALYDPKIEAWKTPV